jgi:HNH endonuclease
MGRRRTNKSDLPQRLFFRHGAYYYVHGGIWEPFGKDKAWAVEEARSLNAMKRAARVAAIGAFRQATALVKEQVMARCKFACVYCGSTEDLGIDHVIPFIQGGSSHPFNLVAACGSCNASKNDSDPREFILQILGMRQLIHEQVRIILDGTAPYWTDLSRNGAPGRS